MMLGNQHPSGSHSLTSADTDRSLWDELLHDELSLAQWPQECEPAWDFNDDDQASVDEDVAAPTTAEIEALLSRLGTVSAAPSAAAAPPPSLLDSRSFSALCHELQAAFLEDITRCTARLQSALLHLKVNAAHQPALNQLRRELHTLKGASATVGLEEWAEYLHQLEDRLLDDGKDAHRPQFESLSIWIQQIQSDVETFQQQSQRLSPSDSGAGNTTAPAMGCDGQTDPADNDSADIRRKVETETVRLPAAQLDQLINTISGLLTAQPALHELYQQLISLRARPVSLLFQRLQQAVRSVSQSEGKDVQLEFIGEDTAIDRSLAQRLFEPLMHLIRNAVCHGIEPPSRRLALGKPAKGSIRIGFSVQSGLLVIDVADDGSGLDYDAIRRRGIELGLLNADVAATEEQLNQWIFHSNFSTRTQVSRAAGRGMGMSAVLAAVEELGGWLRVDSQPHGGMRIQMFCPTAPQLEHVVLFRCASQVFALPSTAVQYAGKVQANAIELDLRVLLHGSDARPSRQKPVKLICQVPNPARSIAPAQHLTLLVDQIIGAEQVVVQPFPALLKHHPYCTGAALSECGETAFIINIEKLVESQPGLVGTPSSTRTKRMSS